MSGSQVLLAHFPEKFHAVACNHVRIYVGIMEKDDGMYQIGWAMYLYDDLEHTQPSEQEVESHISDLSLNPDELNAILDAYEQLPSLHGDDDLSCNYKLIIIR